MTRWMGLGMDTGGSFGALGGVGIVHHGSAGLAWIGPFFGATDLDRMESIVFLGFGIRNLQGELVN